MTPLCPFCNGIACSSRCSHFLSIYRIQAPRYAWRAESEDKSKISGYMKEEKNLLFLKLLNAGHMVPLDLPKQSLEMMQTFMFGRSFDQSPQNINAQDKHDSCPVCPSSTCDVCDDCSLDSAKDDDSTKSPSSTSPSYYQQASKSEIIPWAIAGLAVLSLIVVLIRSRKRPQEHRELVSQYDLELREVSYSDQQDTKSDRGII